MWRTNHHACLTDVWSAMRYVFMLTLAFGLGLFIIFSNMKTSTYERYVFYEYIEAQLKVTIHNEKALHTLHTPAGQSVTLKAIQFVNHPNTLIIVKKCMESFQKAFLQSLLTSLLLFLGIAVIENP